MKKYFILLFLFFSCARAPLKDAALAFRAAQTLPSTKDSLSIETFHEALDRTISAYEKSTTIPQEFVFEGRRIPRADYLKSLLALKTVDTQEALDSFIHENFDYYEVYGTENWGEIFSTGYYDPLIIGSPKKTREFNQALYKAPDDLVTIDLLAYAERLPDLVPLQEIVKDARQKQWRGRLVDKKVVPYFERKDIDPIGGRSPFAGKNMELAWVKSIDAFFLQIQGSGIVEFSPGKRIRVGYAGQNGAPYFAIGKALTEHIPIEQMSMQRIRAYLETLSDDQKQEVFNQNPSFVFFQELSGKSLTFSGAEVTGGRTIATDQNLLPKGTLAFLEIETPVFDSTATEPKEWKLSPRFVFDQDTGGAIRGGGRVDLYFGEGVEAEQVAGVMKRNGKLWYLAPKESFLAKLKQEGLDR